MTPQVISLSAAGSTAWIPVDYKQNPFYINLALVLSDTPSLTCKVEYTLDNIFDSSITPTAFTHTGLSSVSTNTTGSITYPIRAFRLTVTAWTSGTVTLTALQGVTNPQIYTTTGSGSLIYKFPDWPVNTGYLLASLVASSTAARTNNVVTVTATGHAITIGVRFVSFRFYYPGSASLIAGWYDSVLSVPDANTLTFSATGVDFASESINSGAAWTTATDLIDITFPANTLKDQSKVRVCHYRDGSVGAVAKTLSIFMGGSLLASSALTTSPKQEGALTFRCLGSNKQLGQQVAEGTATNTNTTYLSNNVAVDQKLTLRGTIAAASEFIALYGACVEIT